MHLRSRRKLAAAVALIALVTLSSCASEVDDPTPDASASATPTPTPTPTLSAAEQTAAFCKAVIGLDTVVLTLGPPEEEAGATATPTAAATPMATSTPTAAPTAAPTATPTPEGPPRPSFAELITPVADELDRTKIPAVATDVTTVVSMLRQAVPTADRDVFFSPAFMAADANIDRYMLDNCGYTQITGTALDHEFDTLTTTSPAGPTAITLKNEGKEFHELVLIRFNDGVTESIEQILELPEEQALTKVTIASVVIVPPGRTGSAFFELAAGRYAAVCFLGKGSIDGPDGDGPPHFTLGMVEDLTVT